MTPEAPVRNVLEVERVSIGFPDSGGADVVCDATLSIGRGEIAGLVGESGCGKTMLARSVLGLLPLGARVRSGSIRFLDKDLLGIDAAAIRGLRGASIGMVFQEPMMSLNPSLRIGQQLAEAMLLHTEHDKVAVRRKCIEMLERVKMPNPAHCLKAYPHEFSGGMRQRIMLASVLLLRPSLLLADEPTTALDVLIQKEILEIMVEVAKDLGTAVLLITHDLGLVATYANRVNVMRQGSIVEQGSVEHTLMKPRHAYTRTLLGALPRRANETRAVTSTETKPAIVQVRSLRVTFSKHGWWPFAKSHDLRAVDGITFDIHRDETLAVVGESGSGKTTLGRAILQLVDTASGSISVDGQDVSGLKRKAQREMRRRMQIVFQDPYSSLDPRKRIGHIVAEGLRLVPGLDRQQREEKVIQTLQDVGIDPAWARRYPHQLSGGQRQRVAIARAIITRPMLVVADEAVSALDLTVQSQVLRLLKDLQQRIGFSYLFISHDLGVVEQIADRVIVIRRGRVVESGSRDDVFDRPHHPYTCALLNAVPQLNGDITSGFQLAARNVAPPPPPAGLTHDMRYSDPMSDGQIEEIVAISPTHQVAYHRSGPAAPRRRRDQI